MRALWIPISALLLTCSVARAQAPEGTDTSLVLRGFGTLGYANSSNANADFLRDLSQGSGVSNGGGWNIDSILGLQANVRASDSIEFVAQAVAHQRYDSSFDPELTWAFAKFDLNPRVSLRLGRIGTEFLMQSDSRMVGYSYLPVRPPVNFYGGVPINYGDGADVQVRLPLAEGVLKGTLYLGEAREKLPPYDVNGSPIRAVSLGYELGAFQVRLIHAESTLSNSVTSLEPLRNQLTAMGAVSAAKALDFKGTRSAYDSVGMAYDDGQWQLQAALNTVDHETVLNENSNAAYVSVARRIGNFSPYLGYATAKSSNKSLDTGLPAMQAAALAPVISAVLKSSHVDQQTTTVGVRWDFARNLDFKAQLDFVQGDPSSALLYHNIKPGWDGRTTVISMSLDFVF